MKRAVNTGLPSVNPPIEWSTIADGILYTAQLPVRPDGSFETGDIPAQTDRALHNLKRTVVAAGGTMADATLVAPGARIEIVAYAHISPMRKSARRAKHPPEPKRAAAGNPKARRAQRNR